MKGIILCFLLLLAGQRTAAQNRGSPRRLLPPPAGRQSVSRAPPARTTNAPRSGSGSSTSGSGSSGSGSSGSPSTSTTRSFDPLATPDGECKLPSGAPVEVRGYPSSPYPLRPFVQDHKSMTRLAPSFESCQGTRCLEGYDISIEETKTDYGFEGQCAGKSTPSLGYNGMSPGPLLDIQQGVQAAVRFSHNVPANSRNFPPVGPPEEEPDICATRRVKRNPNAPNGAGRGFSIHFHGQASVASMDGWADGFFCANEVRDYIVPNSRPSTLWYHDHAVGITSENVYAGLAGMHIVRPCPGDDPFNVEPLPENHLILADVVINTNCSKRYDRFGVHEDNLYGDINTVNGVPWPKLALSAGFNRFRMLNAAESRAFILKVLDRNGANVGPKICKIVGADAGRARSPVPFPSNGLLTDVAYRWDVVCDFTAYPDQSLYLYNQPDQDRLTSEVPYFCYSHLIMRFDIGPRPAAPGPVPNLNAVATLEQDNILPPALLQTLRRRALDKEYDREVKFGRGGGLWVINGRGWDYKDDLGKGPHIEYNNIGQNNVELWNFDTGGGWYHPIHTHLIDYFCLAVKGEPCPPELNLMPKDVMHIGPEYREITVAARFGPHIGEYMFHCHNAVHEDHEMMRGFMVTDAQKGLTFSRTPALDYTALANTPINPGDADGLNFNTTYLSAAAAPALSAAYGQELLDRHYYDIFYPPAGSPLLNPATNIWLATCPASGVIG